MHTRASVESMDSDSVGWKNGVWRGGTGHRAGPGASYLNCAMLSGVTRAAPESINDSTFSPRIALTRASTPSSAIFEGNCATVASSISGLPGGFFSPSLSVGAGLGADIARFFPSTPMGAIVLLGMVGYFTGVVQAPITAFVIVSEMTDNHNLLIPLMSTALIADATSKLISKDGVYHMLAHKFDKVHAEMETAKKAEMANA